MAVTVSCIQCGTQRKVVPARAETFKFCSVRCRADWRSVHWRGDSHPRWQGGERTKRCHWCNGLFAQKPTEAVSTFRRRKFCSKPCADAGGFRYSGSEHPNYRSDARRKNRGGPHRRWRQAVIQRDQATCQRCGTKDAELHAHHILPFETHPDRRFDVANGITLCHRCHWQEHAAGHENGVNSREPLTGHAEGNLEPSPSGNIREGVTTRGRAYRRWEGTCAECGTFISRRPSDVAGKSSIFCGRACRGKWTSRNKRGKPRNAAYGSNASTSAPPERDDIV